MITLTLPFPSRTLHPNARPNRWALAKAKKVYRKDAWALGLRVKQWNGPLKPPVEAEVTFVLPDRRHRDEDGLMSCLKSAWDGIVDSGLLEDDRIGMFSVAKKEFVVEKGVKEVRIVLRSLNPTEPAPGAAGVAAHAAREGER